MDLPPDVPRFLLLLATVSAALHLSLALLGAPAVLALLACYVALFASGFTLLALSRVLRGLSTLPPLSLADVALSLFASASGLALVSTGLALVGTLHVLVITGLVDGITVAAGLYVLRRVWRAPASPARPVAAMSFAGLLSVLVGAVLLFVIWHQETPYPSNAGWDYMTFIVQVEHIQLTGGFPYVFIPSYPPGGLPYPGMFMDLLGGLSVYLGVSPFDLFWWGSLAALLGFMSLIYALAHHYSRNAIVSAAIAFIGVFLGAAEGEVVRNPLYLTVDMTTQLFFLLAVLWFVKTDLRGRLRSIAALGMAFFIGVFYFYALLPTFPLIVAMVLGSRRLPILGSAFRVFTVANLGFLGVLAVLSAVPLAWLGGAAELFQTSLFPVDQKAALLAAIYLPLFWVPLGLAVALYFWNIRRIGWEPLSLSYFALASFTMLVAYFLPIGITYRFEFYLRSYVLVLLSAMALGPIRFLWHARDRLTAPGVNRSPPPSPGASAQTWAVVVILLAVLPALGLAPLYSGYSQRFTSWYSAEEYSMGQWIQAHVPGDAFLATDPGTAYYMRALAYRNSSVFPILPDGRAPIAGLVTEANLSLRIFAAYREAANASLAWSSFRALGFPDTYLLISTRTAFWLMGNGSQWSSHPVTGLNTTYWAEFFRPPYFMLVYQVGSVYLFSVES